MEASSLTPAAAPGVSMRSLEIRRLGRVAYAYALALQQSLVEDRRAERIGDLLLLVEHPPAITVGARGY